MTTGTVVQLFAFNSSKLSSALFVACGLQQAPSLTSHSHLNFNHVEDVGAAKQLLKSLRVLESET